MGLSLFLFRLSYGKNYLQKPFMQTFGFFVDGGLRRHDGWGWRDSSERWLWIASLPLAMAVRNRCAMLFALDPGSSSVADRWFREDG
jgi:hypothetical protein